MQHKIIVTTEDCLMAGRTEKIPLTEPEIVPCLFATGAAVEIDENVVRFVFWNHLPALGEAVEERRIVGRIALTNTQARNLASVLRKGLARGGN